MSVVIDSPGTAERASPNKRGKVVLRGASSHPSEGLVASALKRQMQVRLQTQVGERIEERRRQVPGLERRKSQSLDSGVSQQALHEWGEIGIAVKIVAVRAQVHAAQHGLPVAELDKPALRVQPPRRAAYCAPHPAPP